MAKVLDLFFWWAIQLIVGIANCKHEIAVNEIVENRFLSANEKV